MEKKQYSELFNSIIYILIGALLIIFQSKTLEWVMTAIGVFFLISGILEIVKRNWIGGGVSLVIGIAIILLGWLVVEIVILVLGMLLAIKGIVTLIDVIKNKPRNALELIFPALTIAIGVFLAFGNLADVIIIITGVLLAIDGVIGLVGAFAKKKD